MKIFAKGLVLSLFLIGALKAANNGTHTFSNGRQVGQIDKVTCQLEVGGDFKHIADPDKKEKINKMMVDCKLVYDEKTLEIASGPQGVARSVRFYEKAVGILKNGDDGSKPALRDERRLIGVEVGDQAPALFAPNGPLNEVEWELVSVLGNSLLLDRFLPDKPVAIGQSWKPSEQLLAQFLTLDSVGQSDVQCTLKEIVKEVARFELAGRVAGSVDSVATEIELKGRFRFDRRRNRIDWLGLLVKEKRNPSPITGGFDVVARLQVLIQPLASSPALTDPALKDLSFQATPEMLPFEHRSKRDAWGLIYGRNWKITADAQDKAELHLFDRGDHIARCTLSPLAPGDPAKLVTLEAFQNELRKDLDKSFGEFVEASESVTSADYRLLRVVIRGAVSDLPMRWVYYHLADQHGHQAVFVFVLEEKLADRLAGHDRQLVDGFRFTEPKK